MGSTCIGLYIGCRELNNFMLSQTGASNKEVIGQRYCKYLFIKNVLKLYKLSQCKIIQTQHKTMDSKTVNEVLASH
jgi:hypothetical protein